MRKVVLIMISVCFSSSVAFGQSEAMKDVINNIAFYYKKTDLKYLSEAKKAVDGSFKTRADSMDYGKNVYKAVVYSSIVYIDSLNKLNYPDTLFSQTNKLVNKIIYNRKAYKFDVEINYIKGCMANVYLRKAFDSYSKNNYTVAIANFKEAKQYVPAAKQINGYLANIYYKLGNYTTAVHYYDTLLLEHKPRLDYIQSAAISYKMLGDTAKCLEITQNGIADYPHDQSLLFEEANILNNKKNYTLLKPLLDELLAQAPNNPDVVFMAANCYDHLGNVDKAEQYYQEAIALNTTDYNPIFNLGLLYLKKAASKTNDAQYQANLDQSKLWLEKAYEISPNDEKCLKTLQMLYLQTGNSNQLNQVNSKLKQLINY